MSSFLVCVTVNHTSLRTEIGLTSSVTVADGPLIVLFSVKEQGKHIKAIKSGFI